MGVRDYQLYKVTNHARNRIRSRFNITNNELDAWMIHLFTQCTFVEDETDFRKKYRLKDVVLIIDTKQKHVVTVYSENEHDDNPLKDHTNPEVKSVINKALTDMIKKRKVVAARKMCDSLVTALNACEKMVKPGTNYRYTEKAWEQMATSLIVVNKTYDSAMDVIKEAERKIDEG